MHGEGCQREAHIHKSWHEHSHVIFIYAKANHRPQLWWQQLKEIFAEKLLHYSEMKAASIPLLCTQLFRFVSQTSLDINLVD